MRVHCSLTHTHEPAPLMKKILLLSLFLVFNIGQGYCQLWGVPPEKITEVCSKRYELVNQAAEAPYLSLTYREQQGLNVTFLFKNERLASIIFEANPSLVNLGTPAGEKKTDNGQSAWFNYAKNCVTRREYRDGLTVDTQTPIEEPQ